MRKLPSNEELLKRIKAGEYPAAIARAHGTTKEAVYMRFQWAQALMPAYQRAIRAGLKRRIINLSIARSYGRDRHIEYVYADTHYPEILKIPYINKIIRKDRIKRLTAHYNKSIKKPV